MRSRRVATLILAGCGMAAIVAGVTPRAVAAGAGDIHIVSSKHLDPRLVQLQLRTPAITDDTGVRVLLPDGYRDHPGRRSPLSTCCTGRAAATPTGPSWATRRRSPREAR